MNYNSILNKLHMLYLNKSTQDKLNTAEFSIFNAYLDIKHNHFSISETELNKAVLSINLYKGLQIVNKQIKANDYFKSLSPSINVDIPSNKTLTILEINEISLLISLFHEFFELLDETINASNLFFAKGDINNFQVFFNLSDFVDFNFPDLFDEEGRPTKSKKFKFGGNNIDNDKELESKLLLDKNKKCYLFFMDLIEKRNTLLIDVFNFLKNGHKIKFFNLDRQQHNNFLGFCADSKNILQQYKYLRDNDNTLSNQCFESSDQMLELTNKVIDFNKNLRKLVNKHHILINLIQPKSDLSTTH